MTSAQQPASRRSVRLERTSLGSYAVTNDRGSTVTIGSAEDCDFTPVELLLAAIGGCSMVDVDHITSRRAEPTTLRVEVAGDKVDEGGAGRMSDLAITWDVEFPEGAAGDEARARLGDAIRMSHDRLCTVGRTVELGTPIANMGTGTEQA